MAQIKWTKLALNDLNEVSEYIALDNLSAAKKLVITVFKSVKRLKDFPESGRNIPEIPDMGYREIIVGPCRIFYRIEDSKVYIVYVMRGERELRKYILSDRENKIS